MRVKSCLAVAALAMASICDVHATDYYIDAVHGNDANSGLAPGEGNAMESFKALFDKYTVASAVPSTRLPACIPMALCQPLRGARAAIA